MQILSRPITDKNRYTFKEVVDGCPIPVVIAGGPRVETDRELLEMVKNSIDVGGAGVAIGRNIFQAPSPRKTTRAIAEIVHNNMEVDDALRSEWKGSNNIRN